MRLSKDEKLKVKGANALARSRAAKHINNLHLFSEDQLFELCRPLNAATRRRVKGGKWKSYDRLELQRSIRQAVGRGTFRDRLERFADLCDAMLATTNRN